MAEITTAKRLAFGKSGNPYFRYAIKRILHANFSLDASGYNILRQLIQRGRVAGYRSKSRDIRGRYIERQPFSSKRYIQQIDRLINEILKRKRTYSNDKIITAKDIRTYMKSICPLWPFC